MFILQADIITNRIGHNGENTLDVFFISRPIGPINNMPTSITQKVRFMYIHGFNSEACQI